MDHSYVGLPTQVYGVEEHRLVGGKGDGMRLFEIRNGSGLELTVSADRCADISRASLNGVNLSWFSPVGYVAPSYYDDRGVNFLRSFTGGFLTTCGLTAAGSPCAAFQIGDRRHRRRSPVGIFVHIHYTKSGEELQR